MERFLPLRQVWPQARGPSRLHLLDDGPGVDGERRRALQAALDRHAYDGVTGLGLLLADRVARAHGGHLELPACESGFEVVLQLAHKPDAAGPVPRS